MAAKREGCCQLVEEEQRVRVRAIKRDSLCEADEKVRRGYESEELKELS